MFTSNSFNTAWILHFHGMMRSNNVFALHHAAKENWGSRCALCGFNATARQDEVRVLTETRRLKAESDAIQGIRNGLLVIHCPWIYWLDRFAWDIVALCHGLLKNDGTHTVEIWFQSWLQFSAAFGTASKQYWQDLHRGWSTGVRNWWSANNRKTS